MTQRLPGAIQTLVQVFHDYACKDQLSLCKRELKELLTKELNLQDVKDPAKLEELMGTLDENEDGQVDFQEFVLFVVSMACLCNAFLEQDGV